MTDGELEESVAWVERMEARYAWGRDPELSWVFAFNVWTYPRSLLIAPNGTVVWYGEPAEVDEALIEKHLGSALRRPVFTWPAELDAARAHLVDGDWTAAMAEIETRAAEKAENAALASYADVVRRLLKLRMDGLKATHAAGDYASTRDLALDLLDGLAEESDEAAQVEAVLDGLLPVPAARAVLAAQAELRRYKRIYVETQEHARKVRADVAALVEMFPDTAVAREGLMVLGVIDWLMPALPEAAEGQGEEGGDGKGKGGDEEDDGGGEAEPL